MLWNKLFVFDLLLEKLFLYNNLDVSKLFDMFVSLIYDLDVEVILFDDVDGWDLFLLYFLL